MVTGEFKANTSNQTITFNLILQFPDTGENQDSEKGKEINGKVVINYEEFMVDSLIALYDNENKLNNISSSGLFIDNTKDMNLRYTGSNPDNYVYFANDNELWRIIGIFTVTDLEGNITKKIKLVRDLSLGSYSWDTSKNDNYGINNWIESDLMKELNGDYLDTDLSANKTNWYNSYWDSSINKPILRQTGVFNYQHTIKEKYQQMISESIWNLGGNGYADSAPHTLELLTQYNRERDIITYQNIMPTSWTGKVGLIYASDYGYASTDIECRDNLRAGVIYNKDSNNWNYSNVKCKNDNWLHKNSWYWTLSPSTSNNHITYNIGGEGFVNHSNTYSSLNVYPSVYLKSNVKITSGTGEKETPYKLSIN